MGSDSARKQTSFLLRYALQSLGVVVVIAIFIRIFLVSSFVMSSASMLPSIWPGDFLMGVKWGVKTPRRGSVVALRCPSARDRFCLKRIVGVPGDRIEFRGADLMVNGEITALRKIGENFVLERVGTESWVVWPGEKAHSMEPVVVPPQHIYLLNDKRSDEEDSRAWGPVPVELTEARLSHVWLSLDWYEKGKLQLWPQVRWPRVFRGID